MKTMTLYLLVTEDNVLVEEFANKSDSRQASKEYEGSRVVTGVCYVDGDNASPCACGENVAEAKKNLKAGNFENWADF